MESTIEVILYGRVRNNAVIRFPDRKNPGVVVQSDTLRALADQADEALGLVVNGDIVAAKDELRGLTEALKDMLRALEEEARSAPL